MTRAWLVFLMVAACIVMGCDSRSDSAKHAGSGLKVIATTGMIADVAREIAGERAQVTSLMGEGVDPHLYRPTRADMALLTAADLVLYNGLLLEGKMTDTLERLSSSGRRVAAVTRSVSGNELLQPAEFEGHPDPHVWMDPALWIKAAERIRDELVAIDPAHTQEYQDRASAYIKQLRDLDAYARQALGTVPEERRALVTAHDAFNYFGRAYGFEVVGIQGISTESEAGVRDIEQLVMLLVSRKIPAVFIETTVSDRNISALIAGAKAQGHEVRIGGALFSDAMGQPGTYQGTYIGMMDHNITTVVQALGGQAQGFKRPTSPP